MKRSMIATCITVLLLVGPWLGGPAVANPGWNIQTVDSTGDVGQYTSLALDAGGNAQIAYFDGTNKDLKYAAWNGSSWNIETVDSEGSVGRGGSLALDSSGNPHISYGFRWASSPYSVYNLKYAAWNGSTWDVQTVNSGGNSVYASLALDSSDVAHIAYYRCWPYGNDLMYTYWAGSSWSDQVVDDGYNGSAWPSLALDSSDNPHISYYDADDQRLRYAVSNGSSWSFTLLDTTTSVTSTSLALDSDGYAHISYLIGPEYFKPGQLKYAAWDGESWKIETVDLEGTVGRATSLALDGSGYPHIVYYDDTNQDLKYAAWDGSSWQFETVDSTGGVGDYVSLALDGSGNPHISYYDTTTGDLMYAFVPEPGTILLLGLGGAALAARRRKR